MKIIVVGAGLSGLTAAFRLGNSGHEVEVIEANDYPGGRCKAVRRDGFLIDTCPELAATSYRRWIGLINEVGLGSNLVNCPSLVSVLQDGRLIDIDLGKLASAALTPALSFGAKLRFLRGMFRLRKSLRQVPHYLIDNVALDDPHGNAETLSLATFGPEVTYKLIEPLLRPIGAVKLQHMSTMLVPYALSDWTQMVTLRGGLERLPQALAARTKVRLGVTVSQVFSGADGAKVECIDANGSASTHIADKCLVTVPYDQAEVMYPRFKDISDGYAKKMRYVRMIDIKIAYGRRTHSKAAMVMLSLKESPMLNLISLSHNKAVDRAPAGCSLFSIFTENQEYDVLAAMDDDELVTTVRRTIEKLYPEVTGHFLFCRVSRQQRVSYVPDSGFFQRTRKLWDAVGNEPRVQLGGDLFMFGGMEAAVASGERAAERLVRS